MSKKKNNSRTKLSITEVTRQSEPEVSPTDVDQPTDGDRPTKTDWKKRLLYPSAVVVLLALVGVGVLAKNGWLPQTDAVTGKKTGWFDKPLPENAASSWNPLVESLPAPPPPTSTQVSKEYIYAGGSGRLLAVEDANATPTSVPADLAIWRPGTGVWWVMGPGGTIQMAVPFGLATDVTVPGDYDGDGVTDFCVFRPNTLAGEGTWYIQGSLGAPTQFIPFGAASDTPAPADYDGDGRTDIAVWSGSNRTFYIFRSSTADVQIIPFGSTGDIPVSADYDGDGLADAAIYRPSEGYWYIRRTTTGQETIEPWGVPAHNDTPAPGDYDGDGKVDKAIRRDLNGPEPHWHIARSSDGQPMLYFIEGGTQAADRTVQNDYDGDGKTDAAVWRPGNGTWYIRQSGNGQMRTQQFGQSGDIPVPGFWRR